MSNEKLLAADLTDVSSGQGDTTFPNLPMANIPYANVTLSLGGRSCVDKTDLKGHATCLILLQQTPGTYTVDATFEGDPVYAGSSSSTSFTINKRGTLVFVSGPAYVVQGQPLVLSGMLSEDNIEVPITGRQLKLSIGNQSCDSTTDGAGNATCTIPSVSTDTGPQQIGVNFTGDAYYLPSSISQQTIVFAFPAGQAFVIGDKTEASVGNGTTVTWWSKNWAGLNSLTGGIAPNSFKGFAANPSTSPPTCGGNFWISTKGNSVNPPTVVPSYMGVIISSKISTLGKKIMGNITKIDVVKTNPGYAPNPGGSGTGTIVASYCQAK